MKSSSSLARLVFPLCHSKISMNRLSIILIAFYFSEMSCILDPFCMSFTLIIGLNTPSGLFTSESMPRSLSRKKMRWWKRLIKENKGRIGFLLLTSYTTECILAWKVYLMRSKIDASLMTTGITNLSIFTRFQPLVFSTIFAPKVVYSQESMKS